MHACVPEQVSLGLTENSWCLPKQTLEWSGAGVFPSLGARYRTAMRVPDRGEEAACTRGRSETAHPARPFTSISQIAGLVLEKNREQQMPEADGPFTLANTSRPSSSWSAIRT